MAAIGVSPDGRAGTVDKSAAVPDFAAGWVTDRDVIEKIFEAVDVVVRAMRPRIEDTEKTDLVTQDLLIEVVGTLEEAPAGCGRRRTSAMNRGREAKP